MAGLTVGRRREFDTVEALDRATRAFWEKGYAGTSLDDLTAAMGIARPSLYRAFGNKEALFARVVEHFERTYLAFAEDALAGSTLNRSIRGLLEGTARACAGPSTPAGSLLTHGAPASSQEDERVRRLLSERIDSYELRLAARICKARAQGELPTGFDCAALATLVITHCCGIALRAKGGVPRDMLLSDAEMMMKAVSRLGPHAA